MPRVAILSDIHSNLPALEAVLEDLEGRRVDEVLVGGDLVGRGPQGNEVCRRLRATGWRTIRGNHEDYLLDFRRGRVPDRWQHAPEWAAARWMADELETETVEWLESLPYQLSVPGLRLVHGSPCSTNEGLGPWCSDDELRRHLLGIEERLLVCAHTHRPMDRQLAEGRVVNVGSVGLPFNRDRRAQYAIFELGDEGVCQVEMRKVPYPLEATLEAYESTGFQARGGVTARLLRMELERALPFLVPFVHWASALDRTPDERALPEFLEFYDPEASFAELYRRLEALK